MVSDKKRLNSYFRYCIYGKRNRLARTVDYLALRLITLAACYLWFSSLLQNTLVTLVLSVLSVALISLMLEIIKRIRLEKFKDKEYLRLKRELFLKHLLTCDATEFAEFAKSRFGGNAFIEQHVRKLTADDILNVCREAKRRGIEKINIVSSSPVDENAEEFLNAIDMNVQIIVADSLIRAGDYINIPDSTIDELLINDIKTRESMRKKSLTSPFEFIKARRYILVALGLLAASFFVKHPLYYRLLSAACVSFGVTAWWLDHISITGSSCERL